MNIRRVVAFLLVLVAVFVCVACSVEEKPVTSDMPETPVEGALSQASSNEGIVIGWCQNDMTNAWRNIMANTGIEYAASKYNAKVIVMNADSSAEKQEQNVEDLVAQGVDVIVLDAVNPDAMISSAKYAVDHGIPVVEADSRIGAEAPISGFVTADNYTIGYKVGNEMGKKWNKADAPNTVIISGYPGDYEGWQRRCGFIDGFTEYQYEKFGKAAINVLAQRYATVAFDGDAAKSQMEDILTVFGGSIDMFFCESDIMTIPCLNAVEASGYAIPIVGSIDGMMKAIELVRDGKITAVGVNSCVNIATTAVDLAVKVAKGESIPSMVYAESPCVTKENVGDYYDPDKDAL